MATGKQRQAYCPTADLLPCSQSFCGVVRLTITRGEGRLIEKFQPDVICGQTPVKRLDPAASDLPRIPIFTTPQKLCIQPDSSPAIRPFNPSMLLALTRRPRICSPSHAQHSRKRLPRVEKPLQVNTSRSENLYYILKIFFSHFVEFEVFCRLCFQADVNNALLLFVRSV